jgi:hypothetical protein
MKVRDYFSVAIECISASPEKRLRMALTSILSPQAG